MTAGQKVIKYLAIALAVGIIVSIITGILNVVGLLVYEGEEPTPMNQVYQQQEDIRNLKIDIIASELVIETGNELSVTSNNKYVDYVEKDGKLVISEKKHVFNFTSTNNSKVILTVPENFIFDDVSIDAGAGLINVAELSTNNLELDLGAGSMEIGNLNVLNKTEIDGGAGKMVIKSGNVNNLDFDMGVGETIINSSITGNSEIDCGVGRLEINIPDIKENYSLLLSKGIGAITVANETVADDSVIGTGLNKIKIDGGIGEIVVNFN